MPISLLEIENGPVVIARFNGSDLIEEILIQGVGEELMTIVESSNTPRIIVDFGSVEHLSSAALGMLIKVHNAVVAKDGRLDLCNIIPNIMEAFVITNLTRLFNIHDTIESAQAVSE